MLTYTTSYRVIYGDTDNMGIAYYANYLRWFEIGRTELLRSWGLPYKEIESQGGLGAVLHDAVIDPNRDRMQVVYVGPKPDLLRHEAQAIMTGQIGEEGIFYADELLLKCPTKYEEAVPEQAEG